MIPKKFKNLEVLRTSSVNRKMQKKKSFNFITNKFSSKENKLFANLSTDFSNKIHKTSKKLQSRMNTLLPPLSKSPESSWSPKKFDPTNSFDRKQGVSIYNKLFKNKHTSLAQKLDLLKTKLRKKSYLINLDSKIRKIQTNKFVKKQ